MLRNCFDVFPIPIIKTLGKVRTKLPHKIDRPRILACMRKSRIVINAIVLIGNIALAIAGCIPIKSEFTPSSTENMTINSPTVQTPIFIASTGSPPTLTLISTIPPTLTVGERQIAVSELLTTNSGCLLPCWWGILPGKTSWAETEKFLIHLGIKIGSTPGVDLGTIYHGTGGFDLDELNVYNNVGFAERNGVVESIYIKGNGSSNITGFHTVLALYSPSKLIGLYGKPSRVWLKSSSLNYGNTGKSGYLIWIFYDDLGFMVRYEGTVEYGSVYHICPKLNDGGDIIDIQLLLQAPDNSLPLERDDSIIGSERASILSIEKAAGISIDEFYRRFTQSGASGCFDTPRDIWP